MQVPVFDQAIEFAQIDTASASTLHCECTKGVQVGLRKRAGGSEAKSLNISVPLEGSLPSSAKFAWRVINVTFAWTAQEQRGRPHWLALRQLLGDAQDQIQLLMSPTDLGEVADTDPFTAAIEVEVTDPDDGSARNMTIPVSAAVRADAVAATSAWGSGCGASSTLPPIAVLYGTQLSAEFTSCDADELRTSHRLPLPDDSREFEVQLTRVPSSLGWATQNPVRVVYNGGYRAVWADADGLGTFHLQLSLGGESVGAPLEVSVTCPEGLATNADGTMCVCPSGSGCDTTGSSADRRCPGTPGGQCTKCSPGTFKAFAANRECDPCAKGSFAGGEGAVSCNPCLPGYYASATGSQSCVPCGDRLSSSGGAVKCDVCGAGYFRDSILVQAMPATCKACWEAASCAANTTVLAPPSTHKNLTALVAVRCCVAVRSCLTLNWPRIATSYLGALPHSGPIC